MAAWPGGAPVSRAGRRARRERLAAAGLWDAVPPQLRDRAAAEPLPVLLGSERLDWLWAHRRDEHPRVAALICWTRALDAMRAEAIARRASAPITRRRAA
jgi:hypothetical protein